ncbi:MAG: hypothetical protein II699_02245, partial [Lachnospiraceae bacterium]|nr:hypothetical protein [Lachnospiraceae bacterium]
DKELIDFDVHGTLLNVKTAFEEGTTLDKKFKCLLEMKVLLKMSEDNGLEVTNDDKNLVRELEDSFIDENYISKDKASKESFIKAMAGQDVRYTFYRQNNRVKYANILSNNVDDRDNKVEALIGHTSYYMEYHKIITSLKDKITNDIKDGLDKEEIDKAYEAGLNEFIKNGKFTKRHTEVINSGLEENKRFNPNLNSFYFEENLFTRSSALELAFDDALTDFRSNYPVLKKKEPVIQPEEIGIEHNKELLKSIGIKDDLKERLELNTKYTYLMDSKVDKVRSTFNAQKNEYDKMMLAATLGAKDCLNGALGTVDVDTLKKNKMPGNPSAEPDPMTDIIVKDTIEAIIGDGSVEGFKKLHTIYAMMMVKAEYDTGKYYEEVYNSLPKEEDDNIRQLKAMYITSRSECLGVSLYSGLINNVADKISDFEFHKHLASQLVDDIGDYETLTVSQYLDYFSYTEDEKSDFYKQHKTTSDVLISKVIPENEYENATINLFKNKCFNDVFNAFGKNIGTKERELLNIGRNIAGGYYMSNRLDNDWIKNQGDVIADKHAKKNVVDNFKLYSKTIYSKKPIEIITNKGISEIFNNDPKVIEDGDNFRAVSMYILRLEHPEAKDIKGHTNSKEFNNMIKAMKRYVNSAERKSGGRVIEFKQQMIDSILTYIKGKKSVRSHDFGNERFDNVMSVLAGLMKEDDFKAVVDRVNEVRGGGLRHLKFEKNKHLVTVNQYKEGFLSTKQQAINSACSNQDSARHNDLCIRNEEDKAGLTHFAEQLGEINEDYAPIGIAKEGVKLYKQDFVALAFAGYNADDENAYQAAKAKADEALKAYERGDKLALADLIAGGISKIVKEARACEQLDVEHFVVNAEYATRLYEMLNRDGELKKLTLGSGLSAKDLNYASNMRAIALTYSRGSKALETFESEKDDFIHPRDKISMITDAVMVKVINQSLKASKSDDGKAHDSILDSIKDLGELEKKITDATTNYNGRDMHLEMSNKEIIAEMSKPDFMIEILGGAPKPESVKNDKIVKTEVKKGMNK